MPDWCLESTNIELIRKEKCSMDMRRQTAAHGLCFGVREGNLRIHIPPAINWQSDRNKH